jgi:2-polyprenyl-3-methyl-5-hydroxy-6-metoxy-1,4-benzoquinol methylase
MKDSIVDHEKRCSGWTADAIDDDGFRSRFLRVPEIVSSWVSEHRRLEGAEVLDFGCGEGVRDGSWVWTSCRILSVVSP